MLPGYSLFTRYLGYRWTLMGWITCWILIFLGDGRDLPIGVPCRKAFRVHQERRKIHLLCILHVFCVLGWLSVCASLGPAVNSLLIVLVSPYKSMVTTSRMTQLIKMANAGQKNIHYRLNAPTSVLWTLKLTLNASCMHRKASCIWTLRQTQSLSP